MSEKMAWFLVIFVAISCACGYWIGCIIISKQIMRTIRTLVYAVATLDIVLCLTAILIPQLLIPIISLSLTHLLFWYSFVYAMFHNNKTAYIQYKELNKWH